MAKYKKRADGRYLTYVTAGCSADGKPIRISVYGRTLTEFEAKLAEVRSQRNKGVTVVDNKTTLKEWAEKWLKTYKQDGAYNTREMYRQCVE